MPIEAKRRVLDVYRFIALSCVVASAGCSIKHWAHSPVDAGTDGGYPYCSHATAEQMADCLEGQQLFSQTFTVATGLGVADPDAGGWDYNGVSCAGCHANPAPGGYGVLAHRSYPDPLPQRFDIAADGTITERIIDGGFAIPPPLYAKLNIQSIPDAVIMASCGTSAELGIHGVPAMNSSGEPERFGILGDTKQIESFDDSALIREMGVMPGLGTAEIPLDPAQTPELTPAQTNALFVFTTVGLQDPVTPPSTDTAAIATFNAVGCGVCHRTDWQGTDVCLHDLGPRLGDLTNCCTTANQLITRQLVGVGPRDVYLHNAQATTVGEAVQWHGGEAAMVVDNFNALSAADKAAIADLVQQGLPFTPPDGGWPDSGQ